MAMLRYITVLLCATVASVSCSLSDVTGDIFGKQPGLIAAFGDIDADKATDIFVLSDDGKSVDVLEADIDISSEGTKFHRQSFLTGSATDTEIVAVVPGDFNRDSQMDILVMRKPDRSSTNVKIEIYHGNKLHGKGTEFLTITEIFRDQPIVIDGDGDMSPDLFGETKEGKRGLWTFTSNNTYSVEYYSPTPQQPLPPLRVPQSSAFLDLDGDLTADLCAVSQTGEEVSFEFWINKEGVLTFVNSIKAPPQLKVVGQASFVDFNGNHHINIVLPGCIDDACKESAIFVWEYNKYSGVKTEGLWKRIYVNFDTPDYGKKSFVKEVAVKSWLTLPLALRIGDFNLDGYPDALTMLSDGSGGNLSTYILYNEGCSGTKCGAFPRSLSVQYSQPLNKGKPLITSFFDLRENGVLDVLITEVAKDGSTVIRAVEQDFSGDASFLKVMVVSGLCFKNCPHGHSPYGVNQVGPTAKFESTTPKGGEQIGVASQLSQSAYFSLQLPFMLFGLGQTPNFVDNIQVGIPYPEGQSKRSHTWSSIIPNSQVIVIPYPLDSPTKWKHELFVTPSRLVLLTGVSLLGTCAVIGAIVGLLHWRERMEDKKEKLQEAQRFHFDAM